MGKIPSSKAQHPRESCTKDPGSISTKETFKPSIHAKCAFRDNGEATIPACRGDTVLLRSAMDTEPPNAAVGHGTHGLSGGDAIAVGVQLENATATNEQNLPIAALTVGQNELPVKESATFVDDCRDNIPSVCTQAAVTKNANLVNTLATNPPTSKGVPIPSVRAHAPVQCSHTDTTVPPKSTDTPTLTSVVEKGTSLSKRIQRNSAKRRRSALLAPSLSIVVEVENEPYANATSACHIHTDTATAIDAYHPNDQKGIGVVIAPGDATVMSTVINPIRTEQSKSMSSTGVSLGGTSTASASDGTCTDTADAGLMERYPDIEVARNRLQEQLHLAACLLDCTPACDDRHALS